MEWEIGPVSRNEKTMQITNNSRLPAPLVQAVSRHDHRWEPNTISVSGLIQPPQLRALTLKYANELTEDAADRIWSLMGTLLHAALEKHAHGLSNVITEEELTTEVLGWKVVGHYDLSEILIEGETLTDYKLTSVWAVVNGLKPEWISQLNLYAELIRRAGRNVNRLQIVAIGRDWSQRQAKFDSTYPQQQVRVFDVPLWTPERASAFMEHRVRLHQEAERGVWPDCTPDERWAKSPKFALMKKNQKKAVRLFDARSDAEAMLAAKPPHTHFIVDRPGESVRCESYCAVAAKCGQFAKLKANNETERTASNTR